MCPTYTIDIRDYFYEKSEFIFFFNGVVSCSVWDNESNCITVCEKVHIKVLGNIRIYKQK